MSDRRVSWVEGRRALVRWAANGDAKAGDWFEAVARMHEDGHVEGPVTDADRCWMWFSEDLDHFVPDDDADTRPAPDHCGTCFEPIPCGCRGGGQTVPTHELFPEYRDWVILRSVLDLSIIWAARDGVWVHDYQRMLPGMVVPIMGPLLPFLSNRPIYLKPWEEP